MTKSGKTLRFKPLASRRAIARERAALGLAPRRRGGQPGNTNRFIHGRYSGAFRARRAYIRGILRDARSVVADLSLARRATKIALDLIAPRARSPLWYLQRSAVNGAALTTPTEPPLRSRQRKQGNAS